MWCLVSQPNINRNASLVIEVRLSHKATGQECLNQVCHRLGIIELDYFGLQFRTLKGDEIWLNLRNEIRQEMSAHSFRSSADVLKPPVLRFQLKVKFWVPPQLILQESTRHQFYLQARVELMNSYLVAQEIKSAIQVCALAAQAELGDASGTLSTTDFYLNCLPNLPWSSKTPDATQCSLLKKDTVKPIDTTKEEWISAVLQQHLSLKGLSTTLAEYWMLKEVSKLEGYGSEIFAGRWINANNCTCLVSVNPQGVTLSNPENNQCLSVSFSSIQTATHSNSRFLLKYMNDIGAIECAALKLESHQTSIGLYRSITEKHAFYSCETVRSAVTSQFVRDLKGTIASFFNENTDLGKKYVFDIQRTCREVYDNARRTLYQTAEDNQLSSVSGKSSNKAMPIPYPDASCEMMREQVSRLQEALLCRICMDNDIDVAFCPCGHAVACASCANRCHRGCPVCRASFTHIQTIFLPLTAPAINHINNLTNNLA